MAMTPQLIRQIENAVQLIIDESGHGEVVLPIVHGRLLDYIERRPTIRMAVSDAGPPRSRTIEHLTTTG